MIDHEDPDPFDRDDAPIGRVLSRREVLALVGAAGAGMVAGCAPRPADEPVAAPTSAAAASSPPAKAPAEVTVDLPSPQAAATTELPTCMVRPAQTEGPYFVDERLNRSDIRADTNGGKVSEGVPLRLSFRVSRVDGSACTPLEGATVDVWHCDAAGVYSDVGNASGHTFLRGYQVTDGRGMAAFTTIYPGSYQGRTVHIHFKIRTDPAAASGYEFTSQLYFDDVDTDAVYARTPYSTRPPRSTRNADDGLFADGGDQLMLALTKDGDGYATTFDIGLLSG